MSSTPNTAEYPPRPVTYPGTAAPTGHRWSAGVITIIVAAVVVLTAVVTAVLVLPGSHNSKPTGPKRTADTSQITPPTRQPAGSKPADVVSPATGISVADVPITLQPGWDVLDQSGSVVALRDRDDTAVLVVGIEDLDMHNWKNVTEILSAWADLRSENRSNVQVDAEPPQKLDSDRFQLAQAGPYTADLSTQGGSTTVYGVLMVLVNPSTGRTAEVDFITGTVDDFDAKWPQAKTIIESML